MNLRRYAGAASASRISSSGGMVCSPIEAIFAEVTEDQVLSTSVDTPAYQRSRVAHVPASSWWRERKASPTMEATRAMSTAGARNQAIGSWTSWSKAKVWMFPRENAMVSDATAARAPSMNQAARRMLRTLRLASRSCTSRTALRASQMLSWNGLAPPASSSKRSTSR